MTKWLLLLLLAGCYHDMTCAEAGGHEELKRFQPMLTTGGLVLVPITSCEIQ